MCDHNVIMEEAAVSEETLKREERLLRSVCSFQSRLGPPEYRRWRRIHGLQFPLHPMQVAGWFVFVGVGAATFLVMVPAIGGAARQSLIVVLAALFLLHVVSHITALLLDPADPELRSLKVKMAVPEFDRSKHSHVIENGRCHLCNIRTHTPRTKHCSVCNKCVDHFDHHCKWLNHCVGGRNYVAFIVCVVSAVLASLVVVALAVAELTFYHLDPTWLQVSHPDFVFLVVVSALGVTAIVTAGLLLHLCLFHCYISILGITTYEYIRNYRLGKPNQCPGLKETCCRWRTNNRAPTLKRQNTDPDFIDRVKPEPQEAVFTLREVLRLCPKTLDISRRGSLPNVKFKNNQVRPTTEEELNRTLDKIAAQTSTTLPILGPPLTHKVHLQELRSALDLAECGPLRHARRGFKPHPHTPSLSPIRESGLSNPNSPRITQTSRPTTPQISTIFLSNPSSPCLSDEEEEVVATCRSRPAPEDILQTPQMPRKSYSPKQVFIVSSSKLAVTRWSDRTA